MGNNSISACSANLVAKTAESKGELDDSIAYLDNHTKRMITIEGRLTDILLRVIGDFPQEDCCSSQCPLPVGGMLGRLRNTSDTCEVNLTNINSLIDRLEQVI